MLMRNLIIWWVLGLSGMALAQPKITQVYLVRHAEVRSTGGMNPNLSPAGRLRAKKLADTFEQDNIKHVITSQYKRTIQTGSVVAVKKFIVPQRVDSVDRVVERITMMMPDEKMLVVHHSNTVPEILEKLGGPKIVISEKDYGNIFLVTLIQNRVLSMTSLRY